MRRCRPRYEIHNAATRATTTEDREYDARAPILAAEAASSTVPPFPLLFALPPPSLLWLGPVGFADVSLELDAEVGVFEDADTDSIPLPDPAEDVLATSTDVRVVDVTEVALVDSEDGKAVVVVV